MGDPLKPAQEIFPNNPLTLISCLAKYYSTKLAFICLNNKYSLQ